MEFQYRGLKGTLEHVDVTEQELDARLAQLEQQNPCVRVITDRAAQNGDELVLDYAGYTDGVQFPGGTAERQTLTLGSGMFIPGFEDQLVGTRPGDEVTVHVTFPQEYHAPELAGKKAEFRCKVHEIRETGEYASKDAFAQAAGCRNYDELRAQVRENLRRYYDRRAEMELQEALMRKAAATLDYTPTEAELDEAVEQQMQTLEAQLAQRGLRLEDYCQFTGSTPESLRADARADAAEAVRIRRTVDRIAILEGLRATEAEMQQAMEVIAQENGLSHDQLRSVCDAEFRRAVENSVLLTKAYSLVRDAAIVTETAAAPRK